MTKISIAALQTAAVAPSEAVRRLADAVDAYRNLGRALGIPSPVVTAVLEAERRAAESVIHRTPGEVIARARRSLIELAAAKAVLDGENSGTPKGACK
jgi:hypothetical protein